MYLNEYFIYGFLDIAALTSTLYAAKDDPCIPTTNTRFRFFVTAGDGSDAPPETDNSKVQPPVVDSDSTLTTCH